MDGFNQKIYSPQVEGSKIAAELPGILAEVITMTSIKRTRKFVCKTLNTRGYPAKERRGKFRMFEGADLGKLLRKIKEVPVVKGQIASQKLSNKSKIYLKKGNENGCNGYDQKHDKGRRYVI